MKTFQEYYKDFISTEKGCQEFKQLCEDLVNDLSYGFDTVEYASSALNDLINRLNTEEIPPSPDCILVSSTILGSDGDNHSCALLYSEGSILSLPQIKPWDDISLDPSEAKPGELIFYDLNDLIITTRLSCYHMLPRCFVWDSGNINDVLGARVSANEYGIYIIASVLEDIICAQIHELTIDNFPLSFVDDEIIPMPHKKFEDIDYIDEDARDTYSADIRSWLLESFLILYKKLKKVKKELLEEGR